MGPAMGLVDVYLARAFTAFRMDVACSTACLLFAKASFGDAAVYCAKEEEEDVAVWAVNVVCVVSAVMLVLGEPCPTQDRGGGGCVAIFVSIVKPGRAADD
jgi:hypothetical protein